MKGKTCKNITANDSKSYLGCLNELVDEYKNTYQWSIHKKHIDVDYSNLTKEIETNPKAPKSEVADRVRIAKYKNIFSKGYTENCPKEIFVMDFVLKTSP